MVEDSLADIVRAGLGPRPDNPFPFALYHDDGCSGVIVMINRLPTENMPVALADHNGKRISRLAMDYPPRECPHCHVKLEKKDWRIECVRECGA